MNTKAVAILIYGDPASGRNALTEEKYRDLGIAFSSKGFKVESVLYSDKVADNLTTELLRFDAVLVWVNPIEQGNNRMQLDALLLEISGKGCFVSTHPDTILKMGTKDVLYTTREMDWGGDTKMYSSFEDFTNRFRQSLQSSEIRVLKQFRGNGGNGVFKVVWVSDTAIRLTHATAGDKERTLSWNEFYDEFKPFFSDDGSLIDQEWNKNMANGMVRCYVSGTTVAGFGYQEINALHVSADGTFNPPGKRYYYTEQCGLFRDLKLIMEKEWIPQLQQRVSIVDDRMPVIWDADFFINDANCSSAVGKYSLCEINVSCVSPFPPGAVGFMVEAVKKRIGSARSGIGTV